MRGHALSYLFWRVLPLFGGWLPVTTDWTGVAPREFERTRVAIVAITVRGCSCREVDRKVLTDNDREGQGLWLSGESMAVAILDD